jgi:hypothetical protein
MLQRWHRTGHRLPHPCPCLLTYAYPRAQVLLPERLSRHVQRCGPTPAAFMKFELFHIQLNVVGLVIR